MAETATQAVKDAVLPSTQTARHYITAGVSAFTGFALSGYVGMKVAPAVKKLMGGKSIHVVSPETIARVATMVAMGLVHNLTKNTKAGKFAIGGVAIRDVTFYATAGAFANAFGSLVVDLLVKFGGKYGERPASFLSMMTGLSGPAAAAEEAPAEAQ